MDLRDFKLQDEQMIYSSSNINFDGVFYCEGHVKPKKKAVEKKVQDELLSS